MIGEYEIREVQTVPGRQLLTDPIPIQMPVVVPKNSNVNYEEGTAVEMDDQFYVYDYDKYRDKLRGFYIDMETELPGPLLYTEEEVYDAVKNIGLVEEEYREKYQEFYKRFCALDDGNAAKRVVDIVFDK